MLREMPYSQNTWRFAGPDTLQAFQDEVSGMVALQDMILRVRVCRDVPGRFSWPRLDHYIGLLARCRNLRRVTIRITPCGLPDFLSELLLALQSHDLTRNSNRRCRPKLEQLILECDCEGENGSDHCSRSIPIETAVQSHSSVCSGERIT